MVRRRSLKRNVNDHVFNLVITIFIKSDETIFQPDSFSLKPRGFYIVTFIKILIFTVEFLNFLILLILPMLEKKNDLHLPHFVLYRYPYLFNQVLIGKDKSDLALEQINFHPKISRLFSLLLFLV